MCVHDDVVGRESPIKVRVEGPLDFLSWKATYDMLAKVPTARLPAHTCTQTDRQRDRHAHAHVALPQGCHLCSADQAQRLNKLLVSVCLYDQLAVHFVDRGLSKSARIKTLPPPRWRKGGWAVSTTLTRAVNLVSRLSSSLVVTAVDWSLSVPVCGGRGVGMQPRSWRWTWRAAS